MSGVKGIFDNYNLFPKLEVLKPKPLPPPEPTVDSDARKATIKQLESQLRNKLERFGFNALPELTPLPNVPPSPERIRQIALENAPLLVLPTDNSFDFGLNKPQSNLPADPQEFIANSRWREDVPFGLEAPDFNPFNGGFDPTPTKGKDKPLGDNTNDDLNDNFTPEDVGNVTNERQFLDLNNDQREKLGKNGAPVFYQFQPAKDGEPPKLTYHIFYAYNDAPKGGPIDLNHEGDWERVTYELDEKTFQPARAVLSAHKGSSAIDFKDLDKDSKTNRPLVYVANGSHANYAEPGIHIIEFEGIPVSYDATAMDENGDKKVNTADNAFIFDTVGNLNEVTSQPWYPNEGRGLHWGEIGEIEDSSGPQGPSVNKGAA